MAIIQVSVKECFEVLYQTLLYSRRVITDANFYKDFSMKTLKEIHEVFI